MKLKQDPTPGAVSRAVVDTERQTLDQIEKFGGFYSLHEAMAKLREEFEEVWDICKEKEATRNPVELRKEALQVAACAIEIAALADDPRVDDANPVPWIRR